VVKGLIARRITVSTPRLDESAGCRVKFHHPSVEITVSDVNFFPLRIDEDPGRPAYRNLGIAIGRTEKRAPDHLEELTIFGELQQHAVSRAISG